MQGVRRLGGDVYLVPGSPNTVVLRLAGRVCVIDPGIGDGRAEAVRNAVESVSGGGDAVVDVLLTHGHTDHLAAAEGLGYSRLMASWLCMGVVESVDVRFALVYGGRVSEALASMPPVQLKVTDIVEWGSKPCDGVEALASPGHTPGHTAYIVDGEVVAAGDAVLGERVLARFGIPFAYDLRGWLERLEKLGELARAGYTIVPGHGPVARGRRAVALVEANRAAALRVREKVLELLKSKPMSAGELAVRLTGMLGSVELSPRQLALNRTTVVSVLWWLEDEGVVEPVVGDGGVLWRVKS